MIVLADNDIFLKLVACNLWEEALEVLQVEHRDVRVLNSLQYQLRKSKGLRRQYSEEILARAQEQLAGLDVISETLDKEGQAVQQALLEIEGIDPGEALIFITAIRWPDARILSGDKRALRSLHESRAKLDSIYAGLRDRVVCLEWLLLKLIEKHEFEHIRGKVACLGSGIAKVDTVLRIAFGGGADAAENNAVGALRRYFEDISQTTGQLVRRL
jgi:hypothetical protein